jgi:hypothetical protein
MKFYTHPAFRDVCFLLRKAFKVPGKDLWKLKVVWYHRRRGYELGSETLHVADSKYREFKRIEGI